MHYIKIVIIKRKLIFLYTTIRDEIGTYLAASCFSKRIAWAILSNLSAFFFLRTQKNTALA
jgi:hypothetical protein